MPAHTLWDKNNWCRTCEIERPKENGMHCPECGKQMRAKPRTHRKELMVIRY